MMKRLSALTGCILTFLISVFILYSVVLSSARPELKLKKSRIELKQGEYFDAGMYVRTYRNGTLILPVLDTETVGTKAVVYRLTGEKCEMDAILIVDIQKK